MKQLFIGHTRFSVYTPSSNDWILTRDKASEQAYREALFSSERMEPRMDVFLNITVPQLARAARGHVVRHIVSYSSYLPENYKLQLKQMAEKFAPVFILDEVDEKGIGDIQSKAREKLANDFTEDKIIAFYRLDDDDVLSLKFFDKLSEFVHPANIGMSISPSLGYTGIYRNGKVENCRQYYYRMFAIGLTAVGLFNKQTDNLYIPRSVSHTTTDRHRPVLLLSTEPLFFYTRSLAQDTAKRDGGEADPLRGMEELLSRLPRAVMSELRTDFPFLSERISNLVEFTEHDLAGRSGIFAIEAPSGAIEFTAKLSSTFDHYKTGDLVAELRLNQSDPEQIRKIKVPGMFFSNDTHCFVKKIPEVIASGQTTLEIRVPYPNSIGSLQIKSTVASVDLNSVKGFIN